jgi:hypothetical protein
MYLRGKCKRKGRVVGFWLSWIWGRLQHFTTSQITSYLYLFLYKDKDTLSLAAERKIKIYMGGATASFDKSCQLSLVITVYVYHTIYVYLRQSYETLLAK